MKNKDKQERTAAAEAAREQAARIELEDQTPDCDLSPERFSAKQDRLRKREYRAREAEAKKAKQEAAKAEQYDDIQQYWNFNRARLTEEQRIAMEVRQLQVWDLMEAMDEYVSHTLEETGTTEQDLADTIEEVKADVSANGLCNSTLLVIPRIWSEQEADLRSHFSKPTLDLVTYGFYTAVTERAYEDFRQKFMVKRAAIPQYSEDIRCSSCGREQSVPKETAESYRKDRKWLCVLCDTIERRSRAQSSIGVFQKMREDRVEPFDKWGRAKL